MLKKLVLSVLLAAALTVFYQFEILNGYPQTVRAQAPAARTVDGGKGDIRQNLYVKTPDGVRFFYRVWDGSRYGKWWEEIRSNVSTNADGKPISWSSKKGKLDEGSQKTLDQALFNAMKDYKFTPLPRITHTINYTGDTRKYGRVFRYGY